MMITSLRSSRAINETLRRRSIQKQYNKEHNITPETIRSNIKDILSSIYESDYAKVPEVREEQATYSVENKSLQELEKEMKEAAAGLEFERAAKLRDMMKALKGVKDPS
ncbi:UvrB/UvrC motif-containing protein [Nitrospirota bacterium]